MLKEAIEKIVSLAGPKTFTAGEHTYIADDRGGYSEVRPEVDLPDEKALASLDALVKLVKAEALVLYGGPVFITVQKHDHVKAFLRPLVEKDGRCKRPLLYHALAVDVPGWGDEEMLPFDMATVALQTRFQASEDRDYAVELLSNISAGAEIQHLDDGITTYVTTKKGAAIKGQPKAVKPLVKLRPYRTFQEVEQPESLFLIRLEEDHVTFRAADGGMWKLTARQTVAAWLTEQLRAEVDAGQVVIAL